MICSGDSVMAVLMLAVASKSPPTMNSAYEDVIDPSVTVQGGLVLGPGGLLGVNAWPAFPKRTSC